MQTGDRMRCLQWKHYCNLPGLRVVFPETEKWPPPQLGLQVGSEASRLVQGADFDLHLHYYQHVIYGGKLWEKKKATEKDKHHYGAESYDYNEPSMRGKPSLPPSGRALPPGQSDEVSNTAHPHSTCLCSRSPHIL